MDREDVGNLSISLSLSQDYIHCSQKKEYMYQLVYTDKITLISLIRNIELHVVFKYLPI